MGLMVSAGKSYPTAPAGVHLGVCCDVIDLGMVTTVWEGKERTSRKVVIVWQIGEVNAETGKRYTVSKRYTASLHEKSGLRRDLQSWRGRPFTQDELKGFDLEAVLRQDAMLNVVHNEKGGSTYANVEAVMRPPKGSQKVEVVDYVRVQDRPKEPATNGDGGEFHATDEDVPF